MKLAEGSFEGAPIGKLRTSDVRSVARIAVRLVQFRDWDSDIGPYQTKTLLIEPQPNPSTM